MKNPADKVEKWNIEKLIPYARNSRTHSDVLTSTVTIQKLLVDTEFNTITQTSINIRSQCWSIIHNLRWEDFTGKKAVLLDNGS